MSEAVPSSALEIGSVVAGKFRIESVSERAGRRTYEARDDSAERTLLLVELTPAEVATASSLVSVSHAHLAKVFDIVVGDDGRQLLAVEHVGGVTFDAALADEGGRHASPVDAVRAALRIVDALSSVHAAGASHGFVCPSAVIAEPSDRTGPVLTFSIEEATEYVSPERRAASGPPSEADDVWAVTALLFRALVGHAPPSAGLRSEDELTEVGVEDAVLAKLLVHGLNVDADARARDLKTLKRELARWFVGHAGDEMVPSQGQTATEPPPLPPDSMSAAHGHVPAVSSSSAPTPSRKRIPLMIGVGIIAGLGAAWGAILMRPAPKRYIGSTPASSSAQSKAIDLSEVPVTGQDEALTGDKTATCVAGYLPKGSFAKAPDLSWLCTETDPRQGAIKLRVAVVEGAPKNARPTEAMKLLSKMGWYDMCAFAVVRAGCCSEAPPLSLPAPAETCPAMDATLREIGRAAVAGQSIDEALKTYTSAIHCELNSGRGKQYGRTDHPAGGEDTAFRDLIKALQP